MARDPPGGAYKNVINFYITNTGSQQINTPWTMTVSKSTFTTVDSAWNLTIKTIQDGKITATASASWETLLPNSGSTVNVGMIVSSTSSDFLPDSITINGQACKIVQ